MTQKIRQGGGGRAHHLVHDLAHRADGQLVELKLLIRRLGAHEDVNNHLDIALFQQHDVAALQAGDIPDFNADGRFQIANAELVYRDHADGRCGNIHPVIQHIGHSGCRGP